MAKTFHVDIASPSRIVYKGEAASLVVPCEFGYAGILADHAPMVARLVKGKITVRDSSLATVTFNSGGGGFLEVLKNNATLILDVVTSA